MSRRSRRALWALIAVGIGYRLVIAFASEGLIYDITSFQIVINDLLGPDPLSLYRDVNAEALRWPYPTGYFPFLLVLHAVEVNTGLPFHGLVSAAPIAADVGIAWVVQAYLGDRGHSERVRLAAAALVVFGPSFAFHSAYEGQLDSVAIFPAVLALLVWERWPVGRRAMAAGILIGIGAALKTFPIFALLALLPWASNRRELLTLLGTGAAVPVVALAPWLIMQPDETVEALRYSGLPGLGGLSLLGQPSLATSWLVTDQFRLTSLTQILLDIRVFTTATALVAMAAFLWRYRPPPATGVLMVYLAVFAFGVNFGPRYLLWALPFVLLAGRLRAVILLQAITFPAAALLAFRTHDAQWVATAYVVLMLLLLAVFYVWLATLARDQAATRTA